MPIPEIHADIDEATIKEMMDNAKNATDMMKALAHEGRLMILCQLATGEKSVTELEGLLALRQAAVSQQLARLRQEGIVDTRRDGKTIYYSLADGNVARIIELVYELYCSTSPACEPPVASVKDAH